MTELIEVSTTCACQESARELGRKLVSARLAACVQITGPIESLFHWQGQIQCESEWLCKAKSIQPLADRIMEFISSHHSYEVPEILIQPVIKCSSGYEQWLRASVLAPEGL